MCGTVGLSAGLTPARARGPKTQLNCELLELRTFSASSKMNIFEVTFRIVAALRIKVEFNLRVEDALRVHKLNYCSSMKEFCWNLLKS